MLVTALSAAVTINTLRSWCERMPQLSDSAWNLPFGRNLPAISSSLRNSASAGEHVSSTSAWTGLQATNACRALQRCRRRLRPLRRGPSLPCLGAGQRLAANCKMPRNRELIELTSGPHVECGKTGNGGNSVERRKDVAQSMAKAGNHCVSQARTPAAAGVRSNVSAKSALPVMSNGAVATALLSRSARSSAFISHA
jgi:hypothetical protein